MSEEKYVNACHAPNTVYCNQVASKTKMEYKDPQHVSVMGTRGVKIMKSRVILGVTDRRAAILAR